MSGDIDERLGAVERATDRLAGVEVSDAEALEQALAQRETAIRALADALAARREPSDPSLEGRMCKCFLVGHGVCMRLSAAAQRLRLEMLDLDRNEHARRGLRAAMAPQANTCRWDG